MRLEEPVGQDAVLGHAVEHAVGADDRRVDRPGQDQEADDDDEGVQAAASAQSGPTTFIARPPIRLSAYFAMRDVVGDDHHGQEADAARSDQAVEEDDEGGLLEVLQLGRLDLAVDLGQRLLAGHRQDRVAEGDQRCRTGRRATSQLVGCREAFLGAGFRQARGRGSRAGLPAGR